MSSFPNIRSRRLRQNQQIRDLVRETRLSRSSLVMPLFVRSGKKQRTPIGLMPGMFQLSPDEVLRESEAILKQGIQAILLFGVSDTKDAIGSGGYQDDGVVQQALRLLKKELPQLLLITDVCLCDYTDHGHCGLIVEERGERKIDNDSTLEVLSRVSASMARAGADIIAPSDMMDGRIQKIRDELDAVGFKDLPIMSYAVKYASCFYGPFRDALDSTPSFGDRRSYQMDAANRREAMREALQDVEEGADILMVKPALSSLDIISDLRRNFNHPLAAYQVSGEYSMIKLGAKNLLFDERAAVLESWTAITRAGADIIISYFAKDYAADL